MKRQSIICAVLYALVVSLLGSSCSGLGMVKYPQQWIYSVACFIFYSGYFYDEWRHSDMRCPMREFLSWSLFALQAITLRWLFASLALGISGTVLILTTLRWKGMSWKGERGWIVQNVMWLIFLFIYVVFIFFNVPWVAICDLILRKELMPGVLLLASALGIGIWKVIVWRKNNQSPCCEERQGLPSFEFVGVEKEIRLTVEEAAFIQLSAKRVGGALCSGNIPSQTLPEELAAIARRLKIDVSRAETIYGLSYVYANMLNH